MDQLLARWADGLATAIWTFVAAAILKYLGFTFDPEQALTFSTALSVFLTAVFVGGVHVLAKHFPWLGWLTLTPLRPLFFTTGERHELLAALHKTHGFASMAVKSSSGKIEKILM